METKTVSTGWSDGNSNFGSIFSGDGGDKYYSMPISTVNSAISGAGIPANAVISSVSLTATATIENSTAGKFYLSIGFGGSGSISTVLLNGAQIAYNKMSGSTTQTVSLNAALSNNSINTSKGSYITFRIYSTTWGKKTYKIKDVNLTITYSIPTYALTVTAGAGGTVTGGGTYNNQATATLTATPNTGYKFVQWSDGNTSATRTVTVTGNATYTAEFEPITFYVLFSGYGATSGTNSAPSAITATYGQSYTLPSPNLNTFYKIANITWNGNADNAILNYTERNPNCTFIGWKRDPNSSTMYQPGESVNIEPTTEGENVTFYATWQPATYEHPSATREGYKLKEWNTKADGSGTVYTGDTVATLEDITLYAQWEVAKINKIYVGTSQPKEIYVGTTPVKEIYVGTTKVYG